METGSKRGDRASDATASARQALLGGKGGTAALGAAGGAQPAGAAAAGAAGRGAAAAGEEGRGAAAAGEEGRGAAGRGAAGRGAAAAGVAGRGVAAPGAAGVGGAGARGAAPGAAGEGAAGEGSAGVGGEAPGAAGAGGAAPGAAGEGAGAPGGAAGAPGVAGMGAVVPGGAAVGARASGAAAGGAGAPGAAGGGACGFAGIRGSGGFAAAGASGGAQSFGISAREETIVGGGHAEGSPSSDTLGKLRPRPKGKMVSDDDRLKVSTICTTVSNDDISSFITLYHIPSTVICRRAEIDEPACDDASGDIVIYEDMLEAGLRFPMPPSVCRILHYFSLTPGRLVPNGWRIMLGFLELWRRTHNEEASPLELHAAYSLSESPAPNRGWYYFTPKGKGGRLLTGLRSNCHSWKLRFFFVGGEWASEADRALVPKQWIDAKRPESPVLSADIKRKLQAVRDHPDRDLGILFSKEGDSHCGPSVDPSPRRTGEPSRASTKRKMVVNRELVEAKEAIEDRRASANTHLAKISRIGIALRRDSPRVMVGDLPVTTHLVEPQTSSPVTTHVVAPAAVPHQPKTPLVSSATSVPPAPPSGPKPLTLREKFWRFPARDDINRVSALSTEGMINAYLEGLSQMSASSIYLFSKAELFGKLRQENAGIHRDLSASQGKIAELEAARKTYDADLLAARERANRLEIELSTAHMRATKAEAELVATREGALLSETELRKARERASLSEAEVVKARERASLSEAEVMKARERASLREAEFVKDRERTSLREAELVEARQGAELREAALKVELRAAEERAIQAENDLEDGLADAENSLADGFIAGYDELRRKITAAFPDIDFSRFKASEAPDEAPADEPDGSSGSSGDDGEDEGDKESD